MAKECTNAALYGSLPYCKGKPILPGIRSRLYFIPKRDIVKWPSLPEVAETNMAELATYEGDFTLAADKKWQYIDLIDNKGKIESESQGDPLTTQEVKRPGNAAETSAVSLVVSWNSPYGFLSIL